MKKIVFLLVTAGLVFGLAGCPPIEVKSDYDQYYTTGYRNNGAGLVTVINNTPYDMLLFEGEIIGVNYIVGGVKSNTRNTVNFSKKSDYQTGGYVLLRAVKQSEFAANGAQSRVDHTALVTYRGGSEFQVDIVSTTEGTYQYVVQNFSQEFGLELRENSPSGRKVAYLTKGELRRVIQTPSSKELTLYPVWVAYNNQTKSIVTFTPPGLFSRRDIQPTPTSMNVVPYNFPSNASTLIVFDNISFPFASILVTNSAAHNANFRIAGQIQTPESGLTGIRSGDRAAFELESTGTGLNLNLSMAAGALVIPVRFKSDPSVLPVIENGYVYNINLIFKGGNEEEPNNYEAWLEKGAEINRSNLLS